MKFLQELNESRMFRRIEQLEGKSLASIGERLFEHLIALQILAQQDKNKAQTIASRVMKLQNFDGFRTTQPDLYNLIVLLLKPEMYSPIINPEEEEQKIVLPELRLKRNLRELANGKYQHNDFSQLMIMLQKRIPDLPGQMIQIRRQVSDWERLNQGDKKTVVRRLLMNMRERGIQSDLYPSLENLYRSI